ncbi:MAG: SH3 domain-containing protein [Lachnospiraceae bacterium]|nr:SH3 domain-containing protein [Lachnospiraceae bacterium]
MERSNSKNIALIVTAAIFYILVTVLSLLLMNHDGSVFNREDEDTHTVEAVAPEPPADQKEDEKPSLDMIQGTVGSPEENESGAGPAEEDSEAGEAKTMVMGDEGNITVQSGVLAEPSETAESPDITEEEPSEEPSEKTESKKYYRFKTINTEGGLRIREEPDVNSKSIYRLPPGSEGYVLELGDDWSYVAAEDHVGYCSNEFLSLTEIPEEEYPEELR